MIGPRQVRQLCRPIYRRLGTRAAAAVADNAPSRLLFQQDNTGFNGKLFLAAAGMLGVATTTVATVTWMEPPPNPQLSKEAAAPDEDPTQASKEDKEFEQIHPNNFPPPRPDLPEISLEEIAEHCDEDSMWFTFRGAVYDMTFFQQGHPGGAPRLLMAAGQDLEPYWDVYRQHFRGHVIEWMEKYRIGNLSEEDAVKAKKPYFGDMFKTDPKRHPDLLPATSKPFNGEPRIELLTNDYFTPNELFYVRCHLAVPDICPEEYRLVVSGKGIEKHKFTLADLQKFPKHEVVTTLQCAGNRREDLHDKDHKIFISPHW
jgi:cytochrome b involved in lipid metabolism